MKHLLLLTLTCSLCVSGFAQDVRTTGTVDLLTGFTTELTLAEDEITLTLNGPADRWFAIGFGANGMAPGTDVVFYANGSNGETLYDGHLTGNAPPQEDAIQSWTLVSNEVSGSTRTVIATRPLDTGDGDDFLFEFEIPSLAIIYAHGATPTIDLAYHQGNRGAEVAAFSELVSTRQVAALKDRLQLYPNPGTDVVQLSVDPGIQLDGVRIFDAQARALRSIGVEGGNGLLTLGVSDLPAGIYYLEARTANDRAVIRFAVAR